MSAHRQGSTGAYKGLAGIRKGLAAAYKGLAGSLRGKQAESIGYPGLGIGSPGILDWENAFYRGNSNMYHFRTRGYPGVSGDLGRVPGLGKPKKGNFLSKTDPRYGKWKKSVINLS